MRALLRFLAGLVVVTALWQAAVLLFAPPPYMLPGPAAVAATLAARAEFLFGQALVTLVEILIGLATGTLAGIGLALLMAALPVLGRILFPVLVVIQTLPVFAVAPLLVLWFGFGLASKIVMATLLIFFPITSAFADGLNRTDAGLLDLARLWRASRLEALHLIRIPAALPALVSGLRVAVVFVPIGAVIGEWVGASRGLGFVMLQSNARMQTDLMFAALAVLALVTLALRTAVDVLSRHLIPWVEESDR